ncbi:MAG TPA: AMP-binding protein [Acidimicrobiales bacterium]|nr:AMP-binding protein [Acidimicrobiales bacterium]
MNDDPSRDDHNAAALHAAVAAVVPERECVVAGERRLTWRQLTDRTCRLAGILAGVGLGLRRDPNPGAGDPWESPHDHVALYLHTGPEYLEGMFGAWKARCAAINVNYRYVASELAYVLRDSDAAAVVYHASFASTLAEALPDLPGVRLLLQVDDGSGTPLLAGAADYEAALAAADPLVPTDLSSDDRYILYTGGTTGMPKGVLWRQGDFLATCLGVKGTSADIVATAPRRGESLRTLPAAPFMHGAAHWNAISAFVSGGAVVVPDQPARFDPADVLGTCERERVTALQIVGDPFARPLLDEMDARPYDLSHLRFLVSGGAVLSAPVKARLVERIPALRIVDVLGSSETGRQAVSGGEATFRPGAHAVVLSGDRSRRLTPGDPEIGWLAQAGRVPLGYLGDAAKTADTFPVIDGVRHAVPGDRVRLLSDGVIELLGRDSATINTGGEKVFAEEVEQALTAHPDVADAIVTSRPSGRWGQEIVAVVALRPDTEVSGLHDVLRDHCRTSLASYKVPKAFCWVERVVRSPAGKPDYAWARAVAGGQPAPQRAS